MSRDATSKGDRYFVTDHDDVERETDARGFIDMERRCGFRPKPGCGPFATGGFSQGNRGGRIERWIDGPVILVDLHGEKDDVPYPECDEARDAARALNAEAGTLRHVVRGAAW